MDVVAGNGREALVKTAREVMEHGAEVSPRGQRTRELRHFSVMIEDPTDVLCTGIAANQSTEVVAAEALQLIGGFSDPEFSIAHVPNLARFTNEQGEFDGAYGPRAGRQFDALIARLKSDTDTRQAILSIWDRGDLEREGSKDYPCTLVYGFYIRQGRLELDVTMRSNDVNWGFKNDIFINSQFQLSIATVLGLKAGPYRHTAFSMHLYERDWEWARGLSDDPHRLFREIEWHPTGLSGVNVSDMTARARTLVGGELPDWPTESERWYAEQLGG